MSKFLLGLVLFSTASIGFAEGHYVFPPTPLLTAPIQPAPSMGYYPVAPTYPVYPYQIMQPLGIPYPYGAYPSPMQQSFVTAMPNAPVSAPRYTYTSPYNPNQPAMPGPKPAPAPQAKKDIKSWGDTRYIWPDFYTDQTSEAWDKMINSPHDLGYMPGGWRFPSFSSPDPITVGDAVANQVPPIMEEVPNFMNFTN